MRKNSTKNTAYLNTVNPYTHPAFIVKILAFVLALFLSPLVYAQTFPPATSCTSKDLMLLRADLPAPANDRCNCSGDRVLMLGIRNGTNSFRTSFALWGTLIRKNAQGVVIETSPIFACANGIKGKSQVPNGDNYLPASSIYINGVPVSSNKIHIECGQSLEIVNMYLAWTTSNDNETCDVLRNNPSTINPKCGTQDNIKVGVGVDAAITTTQATCLTGGKIRVTPSGGLPPYEVSLDGGSYIQVPANPGYHEFTNVSGGSHSVVIRDNTSRPVAERCSTTKTPSVGSTTAPTAAISANRTTVTCTNPSATLTASGGASYSWSPGGATTASIEVTPTSTTIYTVTVTDANGCTDTESQQVVADKTPPTAVINTSRTTVTCTNPSATLTASGGASYLWSTGETTAEITVTPTSGSPTYTVTVTGANGCTDQESQQITVDKTVPSFTVCIAQPSLCSNTGSVTFNASGSNLKYSIDNGANYQIGNSFTGLGSGSVSGFKVLNTSSGCVSSAACNVSSDCGEQTGSQRAAEKNMNTLYEQPIELLSKKSTRVKAFPNPFQDRIRFALKSDVSGQGSLELYNMMGQKVKTVFQGKITAGQVQNIEYAVPVHQRTNLLYVFRVGDELTSGKLIGMK
jgi:hypothetical protein